MNCEQPFGPSAKLHHIGLAVHDIAVVWPTARVVIDPNQNVKVAFVSLHGQNIELIEPLSNDSPISQSLRKGGKLVHLCYSVDDIDSAIVHGTTRGYRCIGEPVQAVAFHQRRIAWLFHREFGLFELVERE
jgi:hypothetical protein